MFSYKAPLLTALILCSLLAGRAQAQNGPATSPAAEAATAAANEEEATPQPPVNLTTTAAKTNQLVDQTLPEDEIIPLQAGGQSFSGYYLAASQQPVKGAVILLADRGQHPASNSLIDSLRHSLAQQHWHTLALGFNDNDDDTNSTPQRIAAASQYFNRMGIASIAIVAEGYSASQALAEVAALPAASNEALPENTEFKAVQALIMINANTLLEDGSNSLSRFNDQPVTLIDAYTLNDYQQQQQASQRQQIAWQLNTAYQQIRLPALSPVQLTDSNRVSQRIRGWLDKHMNSLLNEPPVDDQSPVAVK
jgi:hypothetical protein